MADLGTVGTEVRHDPVIGSGLVQRYVHIDVDELDDVLVSRCEQMDIHPAGILWGDGADRSTVVKGHDDWLDALSKARVKAAHRSLRLRVDDLQWTVDADSLAIEFRLGRGAFATSVLREFASATDAK